MPDITAPRTLALVGAISWLIVPIAFQVSGAAEGTTAWAGLSLPAYLLATAGLLAAGVVLVLMTLDATRTNRPVLAWIGLALLGVGTLVSAIAAWAVPLWAGAYGAGMLAMTAVTRMRGAGLTIGAPLVTAPIVMIVLTALEVGTPDSYGDYPVAWSSATWIAGIGAAAGMLWWSRRATDAHPGVV